MAARVGKNTDQDAAVKSILEEMRDKHEDVDAQAKACESLLQLHVANNGAILGEYTRVQPLHLPPKPWRHTSITPSYK
jgi:hypothetical protein